MRVVTSILTIYHEITCDKRGDDQWQNHKLEESHERFSGIRNVRYSQRLQLQRCQEYFYRGLKKEVTILSIDGAEEFTQIFLNIKRQN